jgi:hypothetical protein
MNASSIAASFARGWTAAYTAGLPREIRDRRREEIASDLWEQRHDTDPVRPEGVAARVWLGMPADLVWRSGELRLARRLELMNLKVDRELDWRMRLISHAAVIVAVAFLSGIALGGPQLLLITLPLGGIAVAVELRRLQRDKRELGIAPASDISATRRRRAIILAAWVAVFAIGLVVDGLPGQDLHDKYWYLFVAPMMFAVIGGPIALLMLIWSLLPRRGVEATGSAAG